MLKKYKSIEFTAMPESSRCTTPDRGHKDLNLDDPAIAVMTDHRIERAHLCFADKSIDRAMKKMAEENTRMLLVVGDDDDIKGLITSADISGEKPIKFTQRSGKTRDEIKVRHLMTSVKQIPALSIQDVLDSKIGDVLHTLNDIGSEYVLVTSHEQGQQHIRGVFSARVIARALKIFFDPIPEARTFVEFTKALHGSVFTH